MFENSERFRYPRSDRRYEVPGHRYKVLKSQKLADARLRRIASANFGNTKRWTGPRWDEHHGHKYAPKHFKAANQPRSPTARFSTAKRFVGTKEEFKTPGPKYNLDCGIGLGFAYQESDGKRRGHGTFTTSRWNAASPKYAEVALARKPRIEPKFDQYRVSSSRRVVKELPSASGTVFKTNTFSNARSRRSPSAGFGTAVRFWRTREREKVPGPRYSPNFGATGSRGHIQRGL